MVNNSVRRPPRDGPVKELSEEQQPGLIRSEEAARLLVRPELRNVRNVTALQEAPLMPTATGQGASLSIWLMRSGRGVLRAKRNIRQGTLTKDEEGCSL